MSPLPAGFKVNGVETKPSVPPIVSKIISYLSKLPADDLLDSPELFARLSLIRNGEYSTHPALAEYRQKVGNKLYWGNRSAIIFLRAKLNEDLSD